MGNAVFSHAYGAPSTTENGGGIAVDPAGNVAIAGELADKGSITFVGAPLVSAGGYDVWAARLDPGGNPIWGKRFGDAADQRGGEVATDSAGNVVIAGWFHGTMDFGGGPLAAATKGSYAGQDVYVAKLGASGGGYQWAYRYGDEYDQYCDAVAVDPQGDVLLTGHFESTIDFGLGPLTANHGETWIFVAKLAGTDGHAIWAESFWGGAYQIPTAIATDASGDVVVAGTFQGALTFGTPLTQADGSQGVFVAKFDPSGHALWSTGGGVVDWQVPTGVAVDPLGGTLVTGDFAGAMNLAGGSVQAAGSDDIFLARIGPR